MGNQMWCKLEEVNLKCLWYYVLDDVEGFSIADALFQKDLIGISISVWTLDIQS